MSLFFVYKSYELNSFTYFFVSLGATANPLGLRTRHKHKSRLCSNAQEKYPRRPQHWNHCGTTHWTLHQSFRTPQEQYGGPSYSMALLLQAPRGYTRRANQLATWACKRFPSLLRQRRRHRPAGERGGYPSPGQSL